MDELTALRQHNKQLEQYILALGMHLPQCTSLKGEYIEPAKCDCGLVRNQDFGGRDD